MSPHPSPPSINHQLLIAAWNETRPTDEFAGHAFWYLVNAEASAGLSAERHSTEWFEQHLSHRYFAVDGELLSQHSGEINRFHWRLMQFFTARHQLETVNRFALFRAALTLAHSAQGI